MARTPIHPGEILGDELKEIGFSAKRLADVIQVPPNRLYQILAGKRSMTADTALRLSQYFGMSADFWMNLQSAYELDLALQQHSKAIQRLPKRGDPPAQPRPAAQRKRPPEDSRKGDFWEPIATKEDPCILAGSNELGRLLVDLRVVAQFEPLRAFQIGRS